MPSVPWWPLTPCAHRRQLLRRGLLRPGRAQLPARGAHVPVVVGCLAPARVRSKPPSRSRGVSQNLRLQDYRSAPEKSNLNLRHAIAIGHEQLSARVAGRPGRSEKWRRRRCPWENQPPKRRCHGWYVQTTLSNHAWNCLRSLLAPLLSCALASIRAMALPPPNMRALFGGGPDPRGMGAHLQRASLTSTSHVPRSRAAFVGGGVRRRRVGRV
jgi:hypothetical protein